MPWGSWVAAKNPSQQRKPMKAPCCQLVELDQRMKWRRTKEARKSPTREAIIPRARPFLGSPALGTMHRAAIQGLAKRTGEYQMAPMIQIMTAETIRAQWLRLCKWWKESTP